MTQVILSSNQKNYLKEIEIFFKDISSSFKDKIIK